MIVAAFVHSFPGHSSTSPQVTLHFYTEMKYDTDISIHTFQNNLRTFIFQCFYYHNHAHDTVYDNYVCACMYMYVCMYACISCTSHEAHSA